MGKYRASEMGWGRVKTLATQACDLSSTPRTHMKGESQIFKVVSSLHTGPTACACARIHTLTLILVGNSSNNMELE